MVAHFNPTDNLKVMLPVAGDQTPHYIFEVRYNDHEENPMPEDCAEIWFSWLPTLGVLTYVDSYTDYSRVIGISGAAEATQVLTVCEAWLRYGAQAEEAEGTSWPTAAAMKARQFARGLGL